MLETGRLFRSASGRVLTPAPKIDCRTSRRLSATMKRVDAWLIENARDEAIHFGNELAQITVDCMEPGHMTTSDTETCNMILFDKDFAAIPVPRPFLRTMVEA